MFFGGEEIVIPDTVKLSNFLSIFGIIPWYDFKQHRLVRPKIFKCYSTILSLCLTVLCIHLLHLRCEELYTTFTVFAFFDVAIEVQLLLLTLVTVLGTTYRYTQDWVELFQSEKLVDESEEFPPNISATVFVLKYRKAIFGVGNVYILSVHHINRAVLEEAGHVTNYFASTFILTYYHFLIGFTILYMTAFIKAKYVFINKLLNESDPGVDEFLKNIQTVRKLCGKVEKTVDHFNRLFGWPLAMIFISFILVLVGSSIGALTKNVVWMNHKYDLNIKGTLVNIAYVIQSLVWLTAIIFCCDSVVSQTEELLFNCYRLEEILPPLSKELEILASLKRLVNNKSPKLTAAGFFEIKRSTLLSLLSTTTTYFIVALQFNTII